MSARALWTRLALSPAIALALLVLVDPPRSPAQPPAAAAGLGLAAGAALFALVARRLPPLPVLRPSLALVLVVAAGAEEVAWRWCALSEAAARVGLLPALVVTSLAFAALHRPPTLGHVAAGGVFGVAFLFAGGLLAAWAAHTAYNLCAAAAARELSFSATGASGPAE